MLTVTARGKVNAEAIGEGRSPFEIDKAFDVETTGDDKGRRGIPSIKHGTAAVCLPISKRFHLSPSTKHAPIVYFI